eukprot:7336660-Heterocapsa_arctica.AAC.1
MPRPSPVAKSSKGMTSPLLESTRVASASHIAKWTVSVVIGVDARWYPMTTLTPWQASWQARLVIEPKWIRI